MSTVAERVAAGVAWLDENWPGWIEEIDLDRLDMDSPCLCVLGQVYGSYWRSPLLGDDPEVPAWDRDETAAVDLGFQDFSGLYEELQAEWIRVIEERRAQPADAL